MGRRKILYLSSSGDVGGVEIHLLNLVEGMVDRSYEVFVVCPWGKMAKEYFEAGASFREDRPRLDIDLFYIFRLIKFIRQNQIVIVHAHQLKTVVNGLIAAKIAGVSLKIAHIHTPLSQWRVPPPKKVVNIFVNRIVTNLCADTVVALTEATRRERIGGEGINPEKIVVIPNGVDLRKFKVQSSRFKTTARKSKLTVGTLGRLTVEKNQKCLISAIPYLIASSPHHLKFVIAGDGERRAQLEVQAKHLGVRDRVTFLGSVSEEEKARVLQSFDIFAFPSLAEGFGIALIEAMAAGLPCVVSDLAVLREVADDGRCALLFKTGDPDNLARQAVKLIENEELRHRLGQKARERVKKEYSMERFVEAYNALYNDVV